MYRPPYNNPPAVPGYGTAPPNYGSNPPAQMPYGSQPQFNPNIAQSFTNPQGYQQWAAGPVQQQPQPAFGSNQAIPPGADPKLWSFFSAVDKDKSGKIDAHELQQALSNGTWTPFNLDTINLLIKMFDKSQCGEICFQDFCQLWKFINDWKTCFQQADSDGNGYINLQELQQTLSSFGYNLSPQFYPFLLARFGKKDKGNMIYFDDFINLNAMLRNLTDSFRAYDTNRTGSVTVTYEQFLHMVMSATR